MTEQSFCLFCICQGSARELNMERESESLIKKEKMSLKRVTSKGSFKKIEPIYPPPLDLTTRTKIPIYLNSQRLAFNSHPLTPKPTVRFSWNVDLDQTRKKQSAQTPLQNSIMEEEELDRTKPISKALRNLSDIRRINKASMISIPDNSPKSTPKVQESMIMVDYFHPNTEKLLELEQHLETRE